MKRLLKPLALTMTLVFGGASIAKAAQVTDSYTVKVRQIGLDIVAPLLKAGVKTVGDVDLAKLKAKIENMTVVMSFVENALHEDGYDVDAINYPDENLVVISLRTIINARNPQQLRLLIVHEVLGLMRFADKNFERSLPIELEYVERFEGDSDSGAYGDISQKGALLDPKVILDYLIEKRGTGLTCRLRDGYDASQSSLLALWLQTDGRAQKPAHKKLLRYLRSSLQYHALVNEWPATPLALPPRDELADAIAFAAFEAEATSSEDGLILQFDGINSVKLINATSGNTTRATWHLVGGQWIVIQSRDFNQTLQFKISGTSPLNHYALTTNDGREFAHRLETCNR